MRTKIISATAAFVLSTVAAQADDSAIVVGKSTYGALCANCHGAEGKGGEMAELYKIDIPDLTKLSERAGGKYPFAFVYENIILGMDLPAHGTAMMPIWGDYFMANALEDRGVNKSDAIFIAAGRALSVAYYLETIKE